MTFSGQLRFFAQNLRPDSAEVDRAGEATDQISRAIHQHFKSHSVDRITPFGSHPKKTSVRGMMDVDVIVYINGRHPPFEDIIEELYQIVRRKFDPDCTKNFFQVKLSYKGLKVDLLPATNFLPTIGSHRDDVDRSIRIQHKRALEYVKYEASNKDWYSTSLSGVSVFFERNRSSFSHSLSRLAKYWCSFIPEAKGMVGRSSIMEYLGAYSAEQVAREGEDILIGFRYFLELFESSDKIMIYWTEFYEEVDIPFDVKWQRPLLLDPCNPYNNFLSIKNNADQLREMQPYAEATLARLEAAESDFRRGKTIDFEMVISGKSSTGSRHGDSEANDVLPQWVTRLQEFNEFLQTINNFLDDSETDEAPNQAEENAACILL